MRIDNDPTCIFCRIISGQAPSRKLYHDDLVTAFRDKNPVAPTHVLIVPNTHIATLNDINPNDEQVLGRLFTVARELAGKEGVDQSGFRLILNTGYDGGQVIYHLHLHLIGGRPMKYPIG